MESAKLVGLIMLGIKGRRADEVVFIPFIQVPQTCLLLAWTGDRGTRNVALPLLLNRSKTSLQRADTNSMDDIATQLAILAIDRLTQWALLSRSVMAILITNHLYSAPLLTTDS